MIFDALTYTIITIVLILTAAVVHLAMTKTSVRKSKKENNE
jgi:hypothetical protein